MKKLSFTLVFALLLTLSACGRETRQREVGRLLGADLTGAAVLEDYDSHGGFHGDGYTCSVLQIPEETELLPPGRADFPLPRELEAAVYGVSERDRGTVVSMGPLVSEDAPEIPKIERGWYWFYDYNAENDPRDPGGLWTRGAFNYVLILFDADTDRLYYTKLDT